MKPLFEKLLRIVAFAPTLGVHPLRGALPVIKARKPLGRWGGSLTSAGEALLGVRQSHKLEIPGLNSQPRYQKGRESMQKARPPVDPAILSTWPALVAPSGPCAVRVWIRPSNFLGQPLVVRPLRLSGRLLPCTSLCPGKPRPQVTITRNKASRGSPTASVAEKGAPVPVDSGFHWVRNLARFAPGGE